jgi:hypothetical protein
VSTDSVNFTFFANISRPDIQYFYTILPTDSPILSTLTDDNTNSVISEIATSTNTYGNLTDSLVLLTSSKYFYYEDTVGDSETAEIRDFVTGEDYTIIVTAYDHSTDLFAQPLSIAFTAKTPNSAPTDLMLSNSSIVENAGANAVVGTLSAMDADAGDTATFTLVSGKGSTDNAAFNISGSSLRANASFDFETKSSYSVRVRVTNVEDAAPSTPAGLATTTVTSTSISISWTAATDDTAVVAYNIFRNGLYVASEQS